jgi:hypothetical protein
MPKEEGTACRRFAPYRKYEDWIPACAGMTDGKMIYGFSALSFSSNG